MTKHMPFTALLIMIVAVFTVACSDEKAGEKPLSIGAEKTSETSATEYSAANPVVNVTANSTKKLCQLWNKGQRVQFKLSAARKLHVGVSHGQEMGIDNPVPLHTTRSEVRAFLVKNDGEHCFHFENRDSQNIDVTFTHKIL